MQSQTRPTKQFVSQEIFPKAELVIASNSWSPLQLYSIYRMILATALVIVTQTKLELLQLGGFRKDLFIIAINTYLLISVLSVFLTHFKFPKFKKQLYLHTIVDIATFLILIYASGGLQSGLGILLLLPILLPCALKPGQTALMIAAITVLALLIVEFYFQNLSVRSSADMANTSVLALFIMASSLIATRWFEKASIANELAKQQGVDIANLSQLNQSILDQLTTGIVVLDTDVSIRHMNPTAWDILGRPEDWRKRELAEYAPELSVHVNHWVEKVSPKVVSYEVKHWNTTELTMQLSQLGTAENGVVLMYLEDTSEQREKQQDVKMASLGQLTANIAHEIRNPLGAISHAAQLLSESEELDKADNRMVQIIQSNSKRMNTTIENVLNLSRKQNPRRELIKLKSWLNDFLKDFIMQSGLKKSQINLFCEESQLSVHFDPAHLHQIMWNLCRNAEKYAKEDIKDLHIDIHASQPLHTRDVMINVMDNGAGVPHKNIDRLFEPFFTTSTTNGTGLGLFMSKELCLSNSSSLEYIKLASGGGCFRIVFSNGKIAAKK